MSARPLVRAAAGWHLPQAARPQARRRRPAAGLLGRPWRAQPSRAGCQRRAPRPL